MFESMTDRIAGTLLMGLDVAVEFATLGEYRLVDGPAPILFDGQADLAATTPTPDPFALRPARAAVSPQRDALPAPATALARSRSVVPSAPRRRPASARPGKPGQRTRAGTVEPAAQLCLFSR